MVFLLLTASSKQRRGPCVQSYSALGQEACSYQYAPSHSSPCLGKQTNLIMKGRAKKRERGREKLGEEKADVEDGKG